MFLLGISAPTMIEGILAIKDNNPQKMTKVLFENLDYHLRNTSVTHQKLGTLSWYSPRWTGNIACKGCKISYGV